MPSVKFVMRWTIILTIRTTFRHCPGAATASLCSPCPPMRIRRASCWVPGGGAQLSSVGLLENLKRRGVLETALAYLIVGWLLIQIADIVFSQLHLPDWAATFVTIFVIAGFPIAIILSWFLEYRDGRAVVDNVSPIATRQRRFGRTYVSVIAGLAFASVLVFVYDRNFGLPQPGLETALPDKPAISENAIAVLTISKQ